MTGFVGAEGEGKQEKKEMKGQRGGRFACSAFPCWGYPTLGRGCKGRAKGREYLEGSGLGERSFPEVPKPFSLRAQDAGKRDRKASETSQGSRGSTLFEGGSPVKTMGAGEKGGGKG